MQYGGYGLPRIPLPRTPVNRASGKARFFGGLGGDLPGRKDHPQLAHHAQVVSRPQCSMPLPSWNRTKCMLFCRTERPVGGIPIKGPLWVLEGEERRAPSAAVSFDQVP
jgi:hypothetical protein